MPVQTLSIGDKFPELEVVTTHGVKKLPQDYGGKWFILFSHPADFTPVCTTEFVAFAKRYGDFKRLGVELIGLSVDSVYSHIKWIEWIKDRLGIDVPFPVIADPRGTVASELGLLHTQSSTHTVRAVIVVDPKGVVRAVLYYPQETGRNVDELLRLVKALQVCDTQKVALPANWPNNELIDGRGIIPPASTVSEARERLERYECFDWWFCHREIPRSDVDEAGEFLKRAAGKEG